MTTAAPALDAAAAEAARREVNAVVTRSGTSFFWAMRLLPREKREAMFAVYAFCREVDDIADGDQPLHAKRAALAEWRGEIERLFRGEPVTKPVAQALVGPVGRFGLAREDLISMLDGMEMDASGPIVAPSWAELRLYCARVAGAVGHMSVRIFGASGPDARALAVALGEAVQLTNVLRDLDEDAAVGRLYLPRELLDRHGVPFGTDAATLSHANLPAVCAEVAAVAERRFAESAALMGRLPRASVRPARIIMGVYGRLLKLLLKRGFAAPRASVKPSKLEKLAIAVRYSLF